MVINDVTRANSEVTWLTYRIAKTGDNYSLGDARIVYSEWDDIRNALREGRPPDPDEIYSELQGKLDRSRDPARILEI